MAGDPLFSGITPHVASGGSWFRCGFKGFKEAFNVIGYAMGYPNRRKGWHKRPTSGYCRKVFEKYKDLDLNGARATVGFIVNDREMS